MKKIFLILLLMISGLVMVSCDKEPPVEKPEYIYTTLVDEIDVIDIEIDETYTLKYIINANEGMTAEALNTDVIKFNENVITGLAKGEATIELTLKNKKQKIQVNVHDKGALSTSFSFELGRFAGKNLVAFGDSVTYPATVGGQKTYVEYLGTSLKLRTYSNFAIGGTTGTYMYEGSNIYKEYYGNSEVEWAVDGVRTVKNKYDNGDLNNVQYAIIAFGHNDQYFQPPLTSEGDDSYDINSFDSCHSFKGSYRYMVKTLKEANPDMRIIILGCTYSQYDLSNPSRYGHEYNYQDYINAMKEVAEELNVSYIAPWDYLMPYYDNYDNKFYYLDSVHLSTEGHKLLANYILNLR